ncbi:MAG: hypothetical protein RBU30_27765 [Polyangia bacterium]|nr:hypothetical protein [Polyangia bacterium]
MSPRACISHVRAILRGALPFAIRPSARGALPFAIRPSARRALALAIWAPVIACALAGCAAAPRHGSPAYGQHQAESELAEPRTIEEWEASQRWHSGALADLAGVGQRVHESESRRPGRRLRHLAADDRPDSEGQAPSTPSGRDWRRPAPGTTPGPEPASPSQPAPSARAERLGSRDQAKKESSLRCQRICRHVQAICLAGSRICRIAGSLGEASAREACTRGEARCAEARGLAGRLCPSCPEAREGRRSRPWRRWSALASSRWSCLD